ncbi:MFS transporter [Zavarzinia compransoris]|uniref:MFS transporter n=1 Tax=Zavarzinia compransoris TaxID=1264899 RepID=A0A317E0N0_9PROT|nr:MFS transporter [Zavarzinia compransoris]PWR20608.1 MFS transporter [Zavarzinia compransoris]
MDDEPPPLVPPPAPHGGTGASASRLAQASWTTFDWAFQPFFTLVTTFIFAPYFVAAVAPDAVAGQALWGYTQTVAGIAIALLSPVLGAVADAAGPRKPWILVLAACTFAGCALLWFAVPGAGGGMLLLTLAAITLATIGAEFAIVFNNAMLPGLVPPHRIGVLSAIGWGVGYIGGLISLGLVLGLFVLPEVPAFGLDKAAHEAERLSGPLSALWLLVFILPMFLFVPDQPRTTLSRRAAVRQGLAQLGATLRHLPGHRNILRFLLAHMIYGDALLAIFAFGGIYARATFGWDLLTIGIFGILLNVLAMTGSFLGGWLEARAGSKATIAVSLVMLILGTIGILSISGERIFFVFEVTPPAPGRALFDSPAEWAFLASTLVLGLPFGPAQASSRSLLARLAPPRLMTEFFGLYALSGKATAFLAPFLIGVITEVTRDQRLGIAVVLPFLALGLWLLAGVREDRPER